MNDLDWQTSTDPLALLQFLAEYEDLSKHQRKLRLLAAGCCRFVWSDLFDARLRDTVAGVERLAAGPLYQRKLEVLCDAADDVRFAQTRQAWWWYERGLVDDELFATDRVGQIRYLDGHLTPRQRTLVAAVVACANPNDPFLAATATVSTLQTLVGNPMLANAVREVFGNPFTIPDVALTWRTRSVLDLARTIEADQHYGLLPILGDALMDAGCDDEAVLQHCQEPATHLRGCWLLDRLLVRG